MAPGSHREARRKVLAAHRDQSIAAPAGIIQVLSFQIKLKWVIYLKSAYFRSRWRANISYNTDTS
jgi:hypothetical protein